MLSRLIRRCGAALAIVLIGYFGSSANAAPIGSLDQVVFEGGTWKIKGWACEPGLGAAIGLDIFVGFSQYSPVLTPTNQWAEPDIHTACGLSPTSGINLRFTVALTSFSPSGQSISVFAVSSNGTSAINNSGQLSLPTSTNHAQTVIANASRILVYTAHPDDETAFAPMLGKYCGSKTCKIVVATKGGGPDAICLLGVSACGTYNATTGYANIDTIRSGEMTTAASQVPATLEQGALTAGPAAATVSGVLARWSTDLASLGTNFDAVVANEINTFAPDVILTFDPRHGTSCHPEHRAIGAAVVQAVNNYSGSSFSKNNLFILTTKRVTTSLGTGFTPLVPTDNTSVVYSADEYIPSKGKTGWAYLLENLAYHQSQFSSSDIISASNAETLDRTTAFQRAGSSSGPPDYVPSDWRYLVCP